MDEVARASAGVDRDLDRVRSIVRRDPGRDALARLDRVHEGGAVAALVAGRGRREAELLAALRRQAEADEPPAVHGHEVDRLRRRELGRDDEVALVLAVGSVDDDDEASLPDVLDRVLDGRKRGDLAEDAHRGNRSPVTWRPGARRTSPGRRPRG